MADVKRVADVLVLHILFTLNLSTVSVAQNERMIVNDELETMRKEVVEA